MNIGMKSLEKRFEKRDASSSEARKKRCTIFEKKYSNLLLHKVGYGAKKKQEKMKRETQDDDNWLRR